MPCSNDPGDPCPPSLFSELVLPSATRKASAIAWWKFRGSMTRPTHLLSTLHNGGCPTPRKTRYRLAATLGRVGLAPTGVQLTLSAGPSLLPDDQALPGAREWFSLV